MCSSERRRVSKGYLRGPQSRAALRISQEVRTRNCSMICSQQEKKEYAGKTSRGQKLKSDVPRKREMSAQRSTPMARSGQPEQHFRVNFVPPTLPLPAPKRQCIRYIEPRLHSPPLTARGCRRRSRLQLWPAVWPRRQRNSLGYPPYPFSIAIWMRYRRAGCGCGGPEGMGPCSRDSWKHQARLSRYEEPSQRMQLRSVPIQRDVALSPAWRRSPRRRQFVARPSGELLSASPGNRGRPRAALVCARGTDNGHLDAARRKQL